MEMTLKRGLCHFHDICDFCPLMSPGLPGLRLSPVSFPLETGSIGELGGRKVAYGSTVSEESQSFQSGVLEAFRRLQAHALCGQVLS